MRALRVAVPPVVPAVVPAVVLAVVTACSTSTSDSTPTPALVDPSASTVTVQRRTITSVVTLEAEVVASPRFIVGAPRSGRLDIAVDGTSAVVVTGGGRRVAVPVPTGATAVRALVPDGAVVSAGLPVVEATYSGFAVRAVVPPERIYRLLDGLGPMRAQVTNGPGPFPCAALGDLTASGSGGTEPAVPEPSRQRGGEGGSPAGAAPSPAELTGATGVSLACAAPASLRLLIGSPALLAVTTGTVEDAVAVPVEAVAGLTQQGTVGVVEAGRTAERTVTLGLTDGRYVQVVDGLAEGDQVTVPAPGSR